MELLHLLHFNKLPNGQTQGLTGAMAKATEGLKTGKYAIAVVSVGKVNSHTFYHTVVIPSSQETIVATGDFMSPKEIHELFKTKCNSGESTSNMGYTEWQGYFRRIDALMCKRYQVGIPNKHEWVSKSTLMKGARNEHTNDHRA